MGNCCRSPAAVAREDVKPSSSSATSNSASNHRSLASMAKNRPPSLPSVLPDLPKHQRFPNIEDRYFIDRELGRGEFGVTYLAMDRASRQLLACKSIPKRKLRTAVDVLQGIAEEEGTERKEQGNEEKFEG